MNPAANNPDDGVFKALADEQRRRILQLLRGGEQPAGALAEALSLRPATVSHHLAQLKGADLVRVRREGQQRIYALNTSVVEEVLLLISNLFHAERKDET
jgi:DNA-binding transcriptional ArsR family regulator